MYEHFCHREQRGVESYAAFQTQFLAHKLGLQVVTHDLVTFQAESRQTLLASISLRLPNVDVS